MTSVPQFSFLFLFWFYWILDDKVVQYSITPASCVLNITQSPHCTSTHPGLSNNTKSAQEVLWFGRSQADKTKQNKTSKLPFLNSRITMGVIKTKEQECNKRGWILQLIVGNLWKVRVWGLHSHSYSTVMWSISCIIWWQLFVEFFWRFLIFQSNFDFFFVILHLSLRFWLQQIEKIKNKNPSLPGGFVIFFGSQICLLTFTFDEHLLLLQISESFCFASSRCQRICDKRKNPSVF